MNLNVVLMVGLTTFLVATTLEVQCSDETKVADATKLRKELKAVLDGPSIKPSKMAVKSATNLRNEIKTAVKDNAYAVVPMVGMTPEIGDGILAQNNATVKSNGTSSGTNKTEDAAILKKYGANSTLTLDAAKDVANTTEAAENVEVTTTSTQQPESTTATATDTETTHKTLLKNETETTGKEMLNANYDTTRTPSILEKSTLEMSVSTPKTSTMMDVEEATALPPVEKDNQINTNIIDSALINDMIDKLPASTANSSSLFRERFLPKMNDTDSSLWHPHNFATDGNYRETLHLKSVAADVNFTLGESVVEWAVLQRSSRDAHAIIGRTAAGLLLINPTSDGAYEVVQQMTLESAPTSMDAFMRLVPKNSSMVGVVVVAIAEKIHWITLPANLSSMKIEWTWHLQKNITALRHFYIDNGPREQGVDALVVLSTVTSPHGITSADVYHLDLSTSEFWLAQVITLSNVASCIALLSTPTDLVLAIPQKSHVKIYQRALANENKAFLLHDQIEAPEVSHVAGFQMGGHSYLAIGGTASQILRFRAGKFYPQTILSQTFGTVEYWLPVAARTVRDDLIVLVQHRVPFDTHSVSVIEALVWDGNAFETSSNVPCHRGNVRAEGGLSCLLDWYRAEGIAGAAVINQGGIKLLVPRNDAPSGLFRLHLELESVPDPVMEDLKRFQHEYDTLFALLNEQEATIAQAMAAIMNGTENEIESDWTLNELLTDELHVSDGVTIGEILLADVQWTQEDSNIFLPALEETMNSLLREIDELEQKLKVIIGQDSPVTLINASTVNGKFESPQYHTRRVRRDTKSVKRVQAKSLQFEFLNDIPAANLFIVGESGARLDFSNGKLAFDKPLHVHGDIILPENGRVDGVKLFTDIVHSNNPRVLPGALQFSTIVAADGIRGVQHVNDIPMDKFAMDSIKEGTQVIVNAEKLHLTGNLNMELLNGENFDEFVKNLVFTNIPIHLNHVKVNGKVIAHSDVSVKVLNQIPFPEGFVLKHGPRDTVITGQKTFKGVLTTNEIDCGGTINEIRPIDVVTLTDPQHIDSETTFNQLEVTGSLNIFGNITGKYIDDFLPNPSLLDATKISASCHFTTLIVDGAVHVHDRINGVPIDDVLGDVVYTTDPMVTITGIKSFDTADFAAGVNLISGLINGEPVASFVTTDTAQTLHLNHLRGSIFANKLSVDGLFDSVNITELDENAIKLDGDQYTDAELTFVMDTEHGQDGWSGDIVATELKIVETLNSYQVHDLIDTTRDFNLSGDITFSSLLVDELTTGGDIIGTDCRLNGIELPIFDAHRLSLSRDQVISRPVTISKAVMEGPTASCETAAVNGFEIGRLRHMYDLFADPIKILLEGVLPVRQLHVSGDVRIHDLINGFDIAYIIEHAVWLNRPNVIPATITFLDPIQVDTNFTVNGLINNFPFDEFVEDTVRRDAMGNVVLRGFKQFRAPIVVDGDINTKEINGIAVENLLTRQALASGKVSNLVVLGAMNVRHLTVHGRLNDLHVGELSSVYNFDEEKQVHNFNVPIVFDGAVTTEHLYIGKALNDIPDFSYFLSNLVCHDQNAVILSPKVFVGFVEFQTSPAINVLNGFNMSVLSEDIVLVNSPHPVTVHGPVHFHAPIESAQLNVGDGGIISSDICGCDPDDLLSKGLRIDRPLTLNATFFFAPGTFGCNRVEAVMLDQRPIADLVTLHTPQNLSGHFHINELHLSGAISPLGTVNGLQLPFERQNTLMIRAKDIQYVTAPTTFDTATILGDLRTEGLINGRDLRGVARITGNIVIDSPVSFEHVQASHLVTDDLISGINFDDWYEQALWTSKRGRQELTGNWTVNEILFENDVIGNGLMNGKPITDLFHPANENEILQATADAGELKSACNQMRAAVAESCNSPMHLRRIEQSYSFANDRYPISVVHTFIFNGLHHVLLSSGCSSEIHRWRPHDQRFERLMTVNTGRVREWASVQLNSTAMYFVSAPDHKSDIECMNAASNIWLFNGISFVAHKKLSISEDIREMMSTGVRVYCLVQANGDFKVVELNVRDSVVANEWPLPSNGDKIPRFVPAAVNLGVAVTDGSKLSVIARAHDHGSRFKRTLSVETLARIRQNVEEHRNRLTSRLRQMHEQRAAYLTRGAHEDPTTMSHLHNETESEYPTDVLSYDKIEHIVQRAVRQALANVTTLEDLAKIIKPKEANSQSHSHSFDPQTVGASLFGLQLDDPALHQNIESTVQQLVDFTIQTVDMWEGFRHEISQFLLPSGRAKYRSYVKKYMHNQHLPDQQDSVGAPMFSIPLDNPNLHTNIENVIDFMVNTSINLVSEWEEFKDNVRNLFDLRKDNNGDDHYDNEDNNVGTSLDGANASSTMSEGGAIISKKSSDIRNPEVAFHIIKEIVADRLADKVLDTLVTSVVRSFEVNDNVAAVSPLELPEMAGFLLNKNTTETAATETPAAVDNQEEMIAQAPALNGILSMDNHFLPSHDSGEIVVVHVGFEEQRRHLTAVSTHRQARVPGDHDAILIYEDIVEGHLFQTIACDRPHALAATHLAGVGSDSLLAFVENGIRIRVLIYRGIEGFVTKHEFTMGTFTKKIMPLTLPQTETFLSHRHFFGVILPKKFVLLELETNGGCPIQFDIDCNAL